MKDPEQPERGITRTLVDQAIESSFQYGSGRIRRGVVQRYIAAQLGAAPSNRLARLVIEALEARGIQPMRATGLQYYRNICFRKQDESHA